MSNENAISFDAPSTTKTSKDGNDSIQPRLPNPWRTGLVVISPAHVAPRTSLVNDKDDFCCDLRAQERCLFKAYILPLGEKLGDFGDLDTRRRLAVRGVCLGTDTHCHILVQLRIRGRCGRQK